MRLKRQKIGIRTFSSSVDVTDPCYDRDVWCRMNEVPIKDGNYTCVVWRGSETVKYGGRTYTDTRIGIIGIYLDGIIPHESEMEEIGEIGVDAGLAGFFHDKPDYDNDAWAKFCDRITTGDAWLTEDGFFSSSGYGDGSYGVYAKQKDGKAVALEIRF